MKLVTLIMECYELAGIVPRDRSTSNRAAPDHRRCAAAIFGSGKREEDLLPPRFIT